MSIDVRSNVAYGLSQPLINISNDPIVSTRNPTVRDRASIGQIWVNKTTGIAFFLTRIVANSYTWCATAAAAAAYVAAGTVTAGTGLIATTGAGTPSTRALHVAADGANITGLVTITGNTDITGTFAVVGVTTHTGAVNVTGGITATTSMAATTTVSSGTTMTCGTGLTVTAGGITCGGNVGVTGSIVASTTITSTLGAITATHGNFVIGTDTHGITFESTGTLSGVGDDLSYIAPANGSVMFGLGDDIGGERFIINDFAANPVFTIDSDGFVTAATSITSTLGDITALHGDIVVTTATHGITLPGLVRIITGAGAPAAPLAVTIGDMYINTTAATAITRLYLATAVGAWTNVTCAA